MERTMVDLSQTGLVIDGQQYIMLLAALVPEPSIEQVRYELEQDRLKNPHNDGPPNPRRRSELEIRAKLRVDYAKAIETAVYKG